MKKRKLKKIFYILPIIIILTIIMVTFLKNHDKNVKENVQEKVNKEEIVETKKKMSLIAVGDVLIHESVYLDAKTNDGYDFSKMFTDVEPILKKYDIEFCNQESIIGGNVLGISGYPAFNSPDEIGDEIINLGFNMVSLANNHAMDKGVDAIKYSNSYWASKNIVVNGTHSSAEERDNVKVYEKNGIKYAFLAYTKTLNGNNLSQDYLVDMYSNERAKSDIDKIKDKVDVIIVSMHWGTEYTNTETNEQTSIAEYLSSLGVNLIIGHHPHVVQPVKYVGNTLVIYSLGNFISNQLSVGLNQGIGLMVGMDIVVDEGKVTFENLYKELILSYAENSTNFKVIPFSKLNDNLLSNYKSVENKYMEVVNG